ncbi:uncharacterized protein LOC109022195 isoform X1 [Juglans regia]|uniref:Uncharacterized protein LOC109022195 isoform X1 n=1 Tax=Juglans regia TaxID=51240 RepID=A0A6P9DYW0_JUGRE|nr:uncharacterized protein LOC109022195 isoform X1 [Juglans regia]
MVRRRVLCGRSCERFVDRSTRSLFRFLLFQTKQKFAALEAGMLNLEASISNPKSDSGQTELRFLMLGNKKKKYITRRDSREAAGQANLSTDIIYKWRKASSISSKDPYFRQGKEDD